MSTGVRSTSGSMPVTGSLRPIVVSGRATRRNSMPDLAWTSRSRRRSPGCAGCRRWAISRVGAAPAGCPAPRAAAGRSRAAGARACASCAPRSPGWSRSIWSKVEPLIRSSLTSVDGARRGGARQVLEHRHLAEEVALLEHRERLARRPDLLEDLDLALVDDVHLGAEVALAEDELAGRELDGEVRLRSGFLARWS